ncbi:Zinc finger protein 439 [Frankliniella fusca]|uniref:Zinc finger protein 439 n=1 Tax=Frankliniella fusca TaxID=407009 RepID=A0AAE1LH97_9NEOP|nr:Zinc finger protein 439 [Frankliniella fusca]
MQDVEAGLLNLCRLCGEDDVECSDLFDEKGQKDDLLSKIQLSVRISITQDDGLPTGICNECREKLSEYTIFYQQCHDTQERLREFISIESAMQKSTTNNQTEIKTTVDSEPDDETDDFYFEEAEVEAEDTEGDTATEFLETEENIPADAENESSFAASERGITLPMRNSTPGQKKDVKEVKLTKFKSVQVANRKPFGRGSSPQEDLVAEPSTKVVENSEMHATAPICKVQSVVSISSGSSSSCTQISSSLAPTSEPPPLIKIVKSVVKPFPFMVPPLVPIKNIAPVKPSTSVPSISIVKPNMTKFVPQVVKVTPPTALQPVVKLTRLPESTLMKFVKGYSPKHTKAPEKVIAPKGPSLTTRNGVPVIKYATPLLKNQSFNGLATSRLSMEPPPLVRRLETKVGAESFGMARHRVALELPSVTTSTGAKGRVFVLAGNNSVVKIPAAFFPQEKPQKPVKKVYQTGQKKIDPLPTVKSTTSTSKRKKSDPLPKVDSLTIKKKKSELIADASKPTDLELPADQTEKPLDENIEVKKRKKKKPLLPPSAIPYLVLKTGQLVKLSEAETVPLSEIPIPPVIVMHVSRNVSSPPNVTVEGQINFPDLSSYSGFPVDLGSGLHVRSYPDSCSKDFSVSIRETENGNETTALEKVLVVQNRWLRQHKKKGIFVRKPSKRCRPATCPETAAHIEELPSTDHTKYLCKACGVSFIHRKACEYHVINKHMSEICPYQCKECGKKFATNFLRASHIRHRHVRSPDLLCSICGAAFRSMQVLKGHEMRHTTKDPPFKCKTCGKGFYTKANQVKHELALHGVKKVICDICGESFPSGGRLNEHRLNHTGGLKCKECGKVVDTRPKLRAHKAKFHQKDETFMPCPCGKKFKVFAFLHNHRKICPTFLMQSGQAVSDNDINEDPEYFGDEGVAEEVFEDEVLPLLS